MNKKKNKAKNEMNDTLDTHTKVITGIFAFIGGTIFVFVFWCLTVIAGLTGAIFITIATAIAFFFFFGAIQTWNQNNVNKKEERFMKQLVQEAFHKYALHAKDGTGKIEYRLDYESIVEVLVESALYTGQIQMIQELRRKGFNVGRNYDQIAQKDIAARLAYIYLHGGDPEQVDTLEDVFDEDNDMLEILKRLEDKSPDTRTQIITQLQKRKKYQD